MMYLVTGLPGNGKTLYALQFVAEMAKKEGRTVFYHGIKNLTPELGWHELQTMVEKINARDVVVPMWWLCPAQSIVIIDEAQMCGFGVRPRGQVPDFAQKLETHRHLGIDVLFITQDPKLIDSHDRALCELHFHVMRTFGMQRATIHEFRPVRDNIKSRKGSIEHKWSFPKHVFKWYTSAEAHTHKVRIPAKVWVLAAIIVAVPLAGWFTWSHYLDPHRERPGQVVAPGAPGTVVATPTGAARMSPAEYFAQQTPRVDGLAYTAPVFDEVTKPVQAPYPAACVSMPSKGCRCYSQQGTILATPDQLCQSIVAGGFFVAWQEKTQPQPAQAPLAPVAAVPVVAAGPGSFGGVVGAPAREQGGSPEVAMTTVRHSVASRP